MSSSNPPEGFNTSGSVLGTPASSPCASTPSLWHGSQTSAAIVFATASAQTASPAWGLRICNSPSCSEMLEPGKLPGGHCSQHTELAASLRHLLCACAYAIAESHCSKQSSALSQPGELLSSPHTSPETGQQEAPLKQSLYTHQSLWLSPLRRS